jgi:aspartate/methionine/tyrosine aminotransferase
MHNPYMPTSSLLLASRMNNIAAFEVMEVQTRARELEAQGHDVIHLEIGEPDFRTPDPINRACIDALNTKPMFYTSALGIMPLREAIARFYKERYHVTIDPQRVVVTAGSSAALLLALGAVMNPGDEILMADPCYPCNKHFVAALGGTSKLIASGHETRYQLTPQMARVHWRAQTRGMIVASPSNPTGTVVTADEWRALLDVAQQNSGFLVADEIYQGLTYDAQPTSVLNAVGTDQQGLWIVNSFSKYFQMTGWRLGWLIAPTGYTREIEKLAQNLFISPSTPAQHAAVAAFTPETISVLETRCDELAQRRDFLLTELPKLGFKIPTKPAGAFYIYADVSALTDDSFVFARRVLDEAHVAITPGKDFGVSAPKKHVRIAYTQPIARLAQMIERLSGVLR